jgi:hypothetical protein
VRSGLSASLSSKSLSALSAATASMLQLPAPTAGPSHHAATKSLTALDAAFGERAGSSSSGAAEPTGRQLSMPFEGAVPAVGSNRALLTFNELYGMRVVRSPR